MRFFGQRFGWKKFFSVGKISEIMSFCKFNYKYIKDRSSAGSWRRGYESHQKGVVLSYEKKLAGVSAKVKGNFKDSYETSLDFKKTEVKAQCNCPLKEEWCKHAVAVGLKVIEDHVFDEYLKTKHKIEPDYSDEKTLACENPQGNYVFHFNPKRRQNFFSILIMDRATGKVIRDIEAIFKTFLQAQKDNENIDLNNHQKIELAIFQTLLKTSRLDKKAGWYDVPINKFDGMFQLLSKAEEVLDGRTKAKIEFLDKEWSLVLSVNFSMVGNVLLSLHWRRGDKEEIYPFEEVRYFSRQLKWGRYKNLIFPTDVSVNVLPQNLIKSTFTDVKDADGAKFLFEELPKLKQNMKVEIDEKIEKLVLEQRPPKKIVTMGLDYDGALRISLDFEYDGTRVPYSKITGKVPYVTVKRPKEDLLYWVKRNPAHEQSAYEMLLACKFAPMQTNNLALEKENSIDFYNNYIKLAPDGWVFEEKDDMSFFKLAENPFELTADVDFSVNSTDSFEIVLQGQSGEETISFEEIYDLVIEGNKYFKLKSQGFVDLPAQEVFSMLKAFNTFDVYKDDENKYIVKTFRAGLLTEMKNLGVKLNMSKKFSKFWKQISTFSDMETTSLPKGIDATYREYQVKGFNWLWFLYQYGLNGILADDMGLGKTLQALMLIQKAKEKFGKETTLVVCPTSVVFNWEAEIQKFAPTLKCLKLSGADRKLMFDDIQEYDVVITSYALLRRDITALRKYEFRHVILDEAQNIKNSTSMTAQSVKKLRCKHKLAMSGTPIENRLEELWSIFDFLMPGFLFDLSEFNYRYVNPIMERDDKTVEKRLKSQIYPFILRRMKRDVAKDLPDKVENIAYCEMTPEQRDFYLQVLDSTKEELFKSIETNGLEKNRMSIFSALLRLRQICCHPKLYDKENLKGKIDSGKLELLKEMLSEIIVENHRVLLFSQFVDMLDIIRVWLEKQGIKHEYLTGKTKDRQAVVERFNNDSSIPIFLISLKAGGTGLNLTGADYVIHYDPWWNPAVEDQATDRAYRIGQTKKVFVYRLITKGSVEEKIQKLKSRKRSLVDSVISVDRNISKSLTYEDLKDIFSMD